MQVSSRLLRIIDYLNHNPVTTIESMSIYLGLNDRNIQYELEKLNEILEDLGLDQVATTIDGVVVVEEKFIEHQLTHKLIDFHRYSREERIEYIVIKLLVDRSINLSHLCQDLKVSRTTIKADVDFVLKTLDPSLEIRKYKVVSGDTVVRKLMIEWLSKPIFYIIGEDYIAAKTPSVIFLKSFLEKINFELLSTTVKKIAADLENANMNYSNPFKLILLIAHIEEMNQKSFKDCSNFKKIEVHYNALASYTNDLEAALSNKLSRGSIAWVAKNIIGVVGDEISTVVLEHWVEVVLTINEIVRRASDLSGYNLKNDEELMRGLLEHIKATLYRLLKGIEIDTGIYMSNKDQYTQYIYMIKKTLESLDILSNKNIGESEVSLILLHIIASIERFKLLENKSKNIILLCGGGYGTSSIMQKHLEKNYEVKVTNSIALSQLNAIELDNIDYIISMVNTKQNFVNGIEIIHVSPFLSDQDSNKLDEVFTRRRHHIQKEKKQNKKNLEYKVENQKHLLDYLTLERMNVVESLKNWKEAVQLSGEMLVSTGAITQGYVEEVIKIGEKNSIHYEIGNGLILPHGEISDDVFESGISVLLLKKPVQLPNERFGKIFFFISARTTKDHVLTIEQICNLCENNYFMESLLEVENSLELYKKIEYYIK